MVTRLVACRYVPATADALNSPVRIVAASSPTSRNEVLIPDRRLDGKLSMNAVASIATSGFKLSLTSSRSLFLKTTAPVSGTSSSWRKRLSMWATASH